MVDSAILHFCVACQNIILKKYQTDLTIILIRNGVNLKAAFCKSLWWKIHEYVREVLTIHTNHNHTHTHTHTHTQSKAKQSKAKQSKSRAAFFDPILLHCVSLQLKFYSEYSLSAKVIVKKNK